MDRIFQVSEFNEFINLYLKQTGELIVEGEISEINVSQGKWLFVTIKDPSSNLSVFAPVFNISGWQGLAVGMKVQVTGSPGLFSKSGKFSFTATQIIPSGEGALKIAFEKLKLQFEKEGLFSQTRKRQIVKFPQRIGLITAKNSEAYNDFIKVSFVRLGGLEVYLYSVSVQGRESVPNILSALKYFNEHPELNLDCLVLTRGGGSLEDLQSFNDESVVRAVFSSQVPTVSAIGHERDVSLVDLVADLRASTPSNAAELIIPHKREVLEQVNYRISKIYSSLISILDSKKNKLSRNLSILDRHISTPINSFNQLLAKFNSIPVSLNLLHQGLLQRNQTLINRLKSSTDSWIENQYKSVTNLSRLLHTFDHVAVLKRGYSLTTTGDGQILRSIFQISPKMDLVTELSDGKITSTLK